MKLYNVHLWDENLKVERYSLVVANNEDEAEKIALNSDFLECAEADEVKEINGYRVIFEKRS